MALWKTKKGRIALWVAGINLVVIACIIVTYLLLRINSGSLMDFLQTVGAEYCIVTTESGVSYPEPDPEKIAEKIAAMEWISREKIPWPEGSTATATYTLSWMKGGSEACSLSVLKKGEETYAVARYEKHTRYFSSALDAYNTVELICGETVKKEKKLKSYLGQMGMMAVQDLQYDQLQPEDFYLLAIAAQYGSQAQEIRQGANENGNASFDATLAYQAVQTYFPDHIEQTGFVNENMTVGEGTVTLSRQVLDRYFYDALTQEDRKWEEKRARWSAPECLPDGQLEWTLTLEGNLETVESKLRLLKRPTDVQLGDAPEFYISSLNVTRGRHDPTNLVNSGSIVEISCEATAKDELSEPAPADPGWVLAGSAKWNNLIAGVYYPEGTDLSSAHASAKPMPMQVKVFDQRAKTVTGQTQIESVLNQALYAPFFIDSGPVQDPKQRYLIAGRECLFIDDSGAITGQYLFKDKGSPIFRYSFFHIQIKEQTGETILYANRYRTETENYDFWAWEPMAGTLTRLADGYGRIQNDGNILIESWNQAEKKHMYYTCESKTKQVMYRGEGKSENSWNGEVQWQQCVWEQGLLIEYWDTGDEIVALCMDTQTSETTHYALGSRSLRHLGRQGNSLLLLRIGQLNSTGSWSVYRLDLSDPQSIPVEISNIALAGLKDIRFEPDPQGGVRICFTHIDYITPWGETCIFHLR